MKKDKRQEYGKSELIDTFLNQSAGEVLREVRINCNLSLQEVANKTDLFTKQTLSKYELAKSKLRMNVFFELAKIYNIDPKDLYNKINLRYISKLEEYSINMYKEK